jgi:gamma-glutamyl hercynylcysteine S-oxide synthase
LFAKGEANTAESLIGQTTAVGLFPRGQSLFGLMDGIGNVREWMCNIWGEDLEPVRSEFFNNPQGWRKQVERSGAAQHKTRGGSWISPEAESGWKYDLLMLGDEALFGDVGFRVVFNSK